MPVLFHVVWRLFVVTVAFCLAVLAAAIVAVSGLGVLPSARHLAATPDAVGVFALSTEMMRGVAVAPAFFTVVVPSWLAAALLGETLRIRHLAIHLLVGAGLAVGGVLAVLPDTAVAALQLVAATGFVAGFVHWLIAGRNAGMLTAQIWRGETAGDPRATHAEAAENTLSDRDP